MMGRMKRWRGALYYRPLPRGEPVASAAGAPLGLRRVRFRLLVGRVRPEPLT